MFARERTSARARVHLREEIKRQREYGCGRAAGSRCDMKRTESTLGIWAQTSEEFRKIIAQAKVPLRPQLMSLHTRCVVKRSPISTKDLTHEKPHDIARADF
jgi:hypothetical protein